MRWPKGIGLLALVLAVVISSACRAERRPSDTTSVSAPLDSAKPLAGLKPEAISIAPSPQFNSYNTLRTGLNEGATALEAGDTARAADLVARGRSIFDAEFSATVRGADPALHDRLAKSLDTLAATVQDGNAGAYRYERYVVDVGILRLATLKVREDLGKGDRAAAEAWFSVVANRFDLSKDVQPVGAAWKRVQTGPLDASAQKAVNLSLSGYLATKLRGELKGAIDALDEKNQAKARWEVSGGVAYFDAIKEDYQQQLGDEAGRKMAETLQAIDNAIVQGDEARARTLIEQANTMLDSFDRSVAAG